MAWPFLSRILGRPVKQGRALVARALEAGFGRPWGLEAASHRRPWEFAGEGIGNASLAIGLQNVRRRSQHATINNPWLANGTQSSVTALVGSGIMTAPGVADESARAAISA